MVSKNEINKLMNTPGECRGVVFDIDRNYVINNYGPRGLSKLEAQLESYKTPINYNKINALSLYPVGLRMLSLIAIKEVFKLKDKDIIMMGDIGPKFSIIIKSFIRLLLSIDSALKQTNNAWKRNYTIGELRPVYFNKKEKRVVLSLNIKLHPLFCLYMTGYLRRIMQMLVPNSTLTIKETKCMFKGDERNEYTATWK